MARLGKDIRANVKTGATVQAVVIDTLFGKASVRLLGNGAKFHNLTVIGGPVTKDQIVSVDFTSSIPTVIVTGQENTAQDTQSTADQNVAEPYILPPAPSDATTKILIYHNGIFVAEVEGINFVDGT